MKNPARLLALSLLMPLTLTPVWGRGADMAIIHAHCFPIVSPPIEDATILIVGGRIRSVTARGEVPPGTTVLDASGRTVTPALVNGATQLGLADVTGASDTDDRSVAQGPLGPSFDVQYALNGNSAQLPVARADGVAWAMVYPGGSAVAPFAGQAALIHLVSNDDFLSRAHAAMVVVMGNSTLARAGGSRAAQWGSLRIALDEARAARTAHAPQQVADLLSRADKVALEAVLAGTEPLLVAADRESDIVQSIRLGRDESVRVVILGGAEAWHVADQLASAHVPVILDPQADMPQTFDSIGARLDNAAILSRAGVEIAFSVAGNGIYLSYNAGLAMREGAGLAVANGLAWKDALRAITEGPARIWGLRNVGVIAPGAVADIAIWDGDPLEPASAPTAVIINGRPVSLATRQTALRDRYAPGGHADGLPPVYH